MKSTISKSKKISTHENLLLSKTMNTIPTKTILIERAKFSNKQIKKGHLLTQKELEVQSKNW